MAVIHYFPRRNRFIWYLTMPDGSRKKFSAPDAHAMAAQFQAAKVAFWMMRYAG